MFYSLFNYTWRCQVNIIAESEVKPLSPAQMVLAAVALAAAGQIDTANSLAMTAVEMLKKAARQEFRSLVDDINIITDENDRPSMLKAGICRDEDGDPIWEVAKSGKSYVKARFSGNCLFFEKENSKTGKVYKGYVVKEMLTNPNAEVVPAQGNKESRPPVDDAVI